MWHTARDRGVHKEALQDVDLMLILVGVSPSVAQLLQAALGYSLLHSPCCLLHTCPRSKTHLDNTCIMSIMGRVFASSE